MSEMVELVARAIAACASEHHAKKLPTDRQLTELDEIAIGDGCIWPVELARAAIEALREPTQAMIRAGEDKTPECRCDVDRTFSAMIDAALRKETT